jgi:hypothetical protein
VVISGSNMQVRSAGKLEVFRSDNTRSGSFFTDGSATIVEASIDPIRLSSPERAEIYIAGVERARTTGTGYSKHSNNGSYNNATGPYHEFWSTDASNSNTIFKLDNVSYTGDGVMVYATRNTTDNTFYALGYYNVGAGAYKFRVADSGNVTNTNNSYGAISDIKLKENIVDATPKLDNLLKVKVRNFNYIGNEEKQLGVVAQELEQVFPSMIELHKDRDTNGEDLGTTTKAVKYSVFVPMLIKAVQEQQAIIEELKARIDSLENK